MILIKGEYFQESLCYKLLIMKKSLLLLFCIGSFIMNVKAQTEKKEDQEEVEKKFFKKENLFAGGNIALGLGSGNFSVGVGPYFGYSLNKYVDAAVGLNYSYISQRDFNTTLKLRQSVIGPSAFVRLYPVKFLFAHAQYEYNFIKFKEIYGRGIPDRVSKINVPSFLIGPGFASGRDENNKTFYYITVLFDVMKDINSPYTDNEGKITPIFRAGYNIALFQGNNGGNDDDNDRRSSQRRRF